MRLPPTHALVIGLLVVGLLTGCDATQDLGGPDPDEAAAALATALGSGDFQAVTFTNATADEAKRSYARIVEGMDKAEPAVEVAGVEDSGDTATVQLAWSWPLDGHRWAYRAEGSLRSVDDEWQTVWKPTLVESSLKEDEVLDSGEVPAARGHILGAGGQTLVAERPVERIGIDRTQVKAARAGESARQLAQLVGVDAVPYVKQVEAAGEEAFVEAIVFRRDDLPPEVDPQHLAAIPGAITVSDTLPLAPTREFAAPILGTVGEVTAEMIEDDPDKYQVGDEAGLSGLQARYDDQLRGTPGVAVHAVGPDGAARKLFAEEPTAGQPLKLTLDLRLQQGAERLLAGVGPASALVAIRPSTGDILVAANGPGTDGINLATYGQAAPGSTFKSVSSLALLRAGLTPSSTVPCTDRIVVDGKQFENYDDYPAGGLGRIPFRTAVANSCNTAFISQSGKLADDALADAAASLGMGVDHDLGFPAYFGSVEPPASETEATADMIGQGKILASPMVMATVIGSIQSGTTVLPRLVKDFKTEQADVPELAGGEAGQLRAMLRGVVTSGSGSLLADVPGPPVIAKTGTAEFERDGRLLTHAWMIAAQDDLAVAVFVDEGSSGSGTAGPILESFLRAAR
ncbi:MAG: penicillin-binding transpeptidase domain-containing protein [Nocardioides sp.]